MDGGIFLTSQSAPSSPIPLDHPANQPRPRGPYRVARGAKDAVKPFLACRPSQYRDRAEHPLVLHHPTNVVFSPCLRDNHVSETNLEVLAMNDVAEEVRPEAGKGSRGPNKIQRYYLQESAPNEQRARVANDVTHVCFLFEDGERLQWDLAKAFGGTLPPASVGRAAAAFGINTSAGNAANTADDKTPAGMREAVIDRLEKFEAGIWSAERAEGGPRTTIFFEALMRFRASRKSDVSEAKMAELRETYSDKKKREQALTNAALREVYEQVRHEAAMERAKSQKSEVADADLLG